MKVRPRGGFLASHVLLAFEKFCDVGIISIGLGDGFAGKGVHHPGLGV
jgi:hypothetical protein